MVMNTFREKALNYLRKRYGKRYMAFPADELEVAEYFFWLNHRVGARVH
jgi:hypothetical protein